MPEASVPVDQRPDHTQREPPTSDLPIDLPRGSRPTPEQGPSGLEVFLSVVGITFLVPVEASFSLWGFWVLFRVLRVLRVSLGMETLDSTMPNHEMSELGSAGVCLRVI